MNKIRLNHWFVEEKGVSISLMRFSVLINPFIYNGEILFKLEIVDDSMERLNFVFNSLEEAIRFTEDVVSRCIDFQEVITLYNKIYRSNDKSRKKRIK